MILERGRGEESRELEPAVAVRRAHHGDLYALVAQSGDTPGPFSFDHGSPFELEAKLGKKRDSGIEGFHHDADVVHPSKRQAATLVLSSLGHATGRAHPLRASTPPAGEGTDPDSAFDFRPSGVLKVVFPLLAPVIRRDVPKQHASLKALCER